jgi:hypothetical protein
MSTISKECQIIGCNELRGYKFYGDEDDFDEVYDDIYSNPPWRCYSCAEKGLLNKPLMSVKMEKDTINRWQKITEIQRAIRDILLSLNEVLEDDRRDICLEYKWMRYKTRAPHCDNDKKLLYRDRIKILKKMLNDCLRAEVKQALVDKDLPDAWSSIRMFDSLSDPQKYQYSLEEKLEDMEHYEVDNAQYGFKRPLNETSYAVRMQLEPLDDHYELELEEDDEVTQASD